MSKRRGSPRDPTARIALGTEGIEILHSVLDTLSEREAGIISLRFGLTDGRPKTQKVVGKVYGISTDSVRKLESKVMSKLRHQSRSNVLGVWDGGQLIDFVSAPTFTGELISNFESQLAYCVQCKEVPLMNNENISKGGRKRKYCSDLCRQKAYRNRKRVTKAELARGYSACRYWLSRGRPRKCVLAGALFPDHDQSSHLVHACVLIVLGRL